MKSKTFGEFVQEVRLNQGIGLREFCREHQHDPGNWSKLERGLINPPEDESTLEKYASQLNIKKGSKDWMEFIDLAYITRGQIPRDILSDKELVQKLPLFFRTARGQKPSKEDLKKLIKILRK